MVKHFNILFGGIFLAVGAACVLLGVVLYGSLGRVSGRPDDAWVAGLTPFALGAVFALVGALSAASGLRRRRVEQRLRASGTTTRASVFAVVPAGARLNGRRLWRVHYTYEDMNGTSQRGDSGYLSAEEAHGYAIGEDIFVRYDPAAPAVSMWLGREDAG